MTILIIGAGQVGSQMAASLVERGQKPVLMDFAPQRDALGLIVDLARVTLVEADVLRPLALTEIIRDHGITDILHMAANPLLTLGAQRDPYAAIQLNIMGTVNVLEAARIHKVRRVVVASSSVLNHQMAGGEAEGDAMKEEAFPRPSTFYAATKQAVENLGLNYAKWSGVEFAALRYGPVIGPWGDKGGGGGPSTEVREAIRAALRGEEAVIPASSMEWVYSKDAGAATLLALDAADLKSRIFNVTMGRAVPPDELAAAITAAIPGAQVRTAASTREPPRPNAPGAKPGTNQRRAAEIGLAGSALGYVPKFGIKEAVADMVAWYQARKM